MSEFIVPIKQEPPYMERHFFFAIIALLILVSCGSSKIPQDLPIIPNSSIEKSFTAANIDTVVLLSVETADAVNAFYRKKLSGAGWTAKIDRHNNSISFQAWFSGDKGLLIDTIQESGKTRVVLNFSRGDSNE